MKKMIITGAASLAVTSLLLTGCGETTESSGKESKGKTQQATTIKEKEESTKIVSGVQFIYDGNEVTDYDLDEYKDEFLSGVAFEGEKSIPINTIARHYVLVHELLKEFGSSEEELKESYEEYKQNVDTEVNAIDPLSIYTARFFSEKIVNRDLSTIKTQRELYDDMDPYWKDDMSFVDFQEDKERIFKEAYEKGIISVRDIQQGAMKKASIKNVNLKFNTKLKEGEFLPFSQF